MTNVNLQKISTLLRYLCLTSTTTAASGHATSSLSATDLMTGLLFGGFFKADLTNPHHPNNDRLIFSKGHASPLFYALYAAAGAIPLEEMNTLRKFGSRLEGHPTLNFPYTEAATGSLGQGLSIGLGMALNAKLDKLPYKTYVLLGDSEMAEGSVWEALEVASHYKLNNLIGIIDVNRLGQRGETMLGHDTTIYEKRVAAFGWKTIVIDGHDLAEIKHAYEFTTQATDQPVMIIAKTLKGKGVSFLENKDGWHGKALSQTECEAALKELGAVDLSVRGLVSAPENISLSPAQTPKAYNLAPATYEKPTSTRRAYGNALAKLVTEDEKIVVLDAETSNSTYAELAKKIAPERFFEMYIAEQNMVSTALGLSRRGKIPFVSTFAAFFSRAADQIRMSQYSDGNVKFVGSHAGVSIGEDGSSQMALEDLSLFRCILGSTVLYPSDAVSTEKLTALAAQEKGLYYIRTTRKDTPILYSDNEEFSVGGSKTLRSSDKDIATIVAAGITLHEALNAYEILKKDGIIVRIIDLYSIKPIDAATLKRATTETKHVITVEDHYPEGGIGEAVRTALNDTPHPVHSLAVRKMSKSGKPEELLDYEEISAAAIVRKVRELVG